MLKFSHLCNKELELDYLGFSGSKWGMKTSLLANCLLSAVYQRACLLGGKEAQGGQIAEKSRKGRLRSEDGVAFIRLDSSN